MRLAGCLVTIAALAFCAPALAAKSSKVNVHLITADGVGKSVGTITIKEDKAGVILETKLTGLPPGEHGFHLHEKPSCDPADKEGKKTAGEAAGPHYDPAMTKSHKGPEGGGHKGDLPKLVVSDKGEAKDKLSVKGLTLADFSGKSLMIHAGGDNYADQPKPLGGGGARVACGVID